jgi:hypothetical protein
MDERKFLRIGQYMQLEEQPDGQWKAFYPLEDWSVTAPTRVEAFRQAAAELERLQQDPGHGERQREKARQFLGKNVPGLEVEEMDADAYDARMRDLPKIAEEISKTVPSDIRAAIDEGRA